MKASELTQSILLYTSGVCDGDMNEAMMGLTFATASLYLSSGFTQEQAEELFSYAFERLAIRKAEVNE